MAVYKVIDVAEGREIGEYRGLEIRQTQTGFGAWSAQIYNKHGRLSAYEPIGRPRKSQARMAAIKWIDTNVPRRTEGKRTKPTQRPESWGTW